MSPESEQFDELRRLLALKRYEQPPPGFFNHFSGQVIARIQAGERGNDSLLQNFFDSSSWLSRLWSSVGAKPILAGAFGVTVCSVLIAGVAFSDRGDARNLPMVATSIRDQSGLTMSSSPVTALLEPVAATPGQIMGNVLPEQERTSLFQDVHPRAQLIMDVVAPAPSK
jgi:hypothetical protein